MVVSECVCVRESSEYSFEGVCSLEQNQGPQAAGFRWGGAGGGEGSCVGVGGNPEGPLCASRAGRASVRPGGRPVWHSMSASKASRSLTTSGCRFS